MQRQKDTVKPVDRKQSDLYQRDTGVRDRTVWSQNDKKGKCRSYAKGVWPVNHKQSNSTALHGKRGN